MLRLEWERVLIGPAVCVLVAACERQPESSPQQASPTTSARQPYSGEQRAVPSAPAGTRLDAGEQAESRLRDQLAAARSQFAKALDAAPSLRIDLTQRVQSMTSAELIQANQQVVAPAVEAFQSLVRTYTTEVKQALAPLHAEIGEQEARAQEEAALGVRIVIEPRELGKGYQGRFTDEQVYIETERYRPEPIPGTIKLGLLDGYFIRDGNIVGTNAFGASVTLKRFVDAPTVEQQRLGALSARFTQLQREAEQAIRDAAAKHATGFTTTYHAILDRAVVLVEQECATVLEVARRGASLPASEQRVADTAAAIDSVAWQPGIGTKWVDCLEVALGAATEQFATPRAALERSATARLDELAALLSALGVPDNVLSEGHSARKVLTQIAERELTAGLLARFDTEQVAYMERLRSGLGLHLTAIALKRQGAVGLKTIRDGLRVDHLCSDGESVLVAAYFGRDDATSAPSEQIGVLRLRDTSVEASRTFSVDPREDTAWADDARALARPLEGGWTVVQHGRWSTILPPSWPKAISIPATRADDVWRLRSSVLVRSEGRPGVGFSRGVYAVKPDGEVLLLLDSPSEFALIDGNLVSVTKQGAGGGSDLVEVADALTGQPNTGFADTWKRLIDYDPFGNGTQAAISNGKVWLFHRKGVQGISTGPTLVPIEPNGKIGTPLFAHDDYWATDGPNRGDGQPVGSVRLAVRCATDTIVIATGRAYIYGTGRDGDIGGGAVIAFDLSTGKELWIERDIGDQFHPVTEARKRRGDKHESGPALAIGDAAQRGRVESRGAPLPFEVGDKSSLVEVTVSADGCQPVTWLVLDDGRYAQNINSIDSGRLLRKGGNWYIGADRIEIVRIP